MCATVHSSCPDRSVIVRKGTPVATREAMGLTNEDAARRCGFGNRLDWAGAKRKLGIAPMRTTAAGQRYLLTPRQVKNARRLRWGMKVRF